MAEEDSSDALLLELCRCMTEAARPKYQRNLYDRPIICRCGDINAFVETSEYIESNRVFSLPVKETPIIFVIICGLIKSIRRDRYYQWYEVGDETGSVHCRADKLISDNVDDEEYSKFLKQHKENRKNFEAHPSKENCAIWEESKLAYALKSGSKKLEDKFSKVQRTLQDYYDKSDKKVMVHGKLAKKGQGKFILIQKIYYTHSEEEKAFKEMLCTVENHMARQAREEIL